MEDVSRSGMTTTELKQFTEMQTTLQMSIQNSNLQAQNVSKSLDAIVMGQKEISQRLERIEIRWDERIRQVEAAAFEAKTRATLLCDDVNKLEDDVDAFNKSSSYWDKMLGLFQVAVGFIVAFFSSRN